MRRKQQHHSAEGLNMKLDPIDYAVISQALIAAAREMGAKLVRSAYSTILREARDGSAALLDRFGNTIAQAELIPMQLGTIGRIFQPCAELFPVDTLVEGDFFAINDPYSGGQHLQDVFFFHPIFVDGRVVAFSASIAHHLDLGGGSPGLNSSARDIYSEGLIIPPTKFNMDRDWNGGPLQRLLRANVRVPHQTLGDFEAQMAANQIGATRIRELCRRYGTDLVEAVMAELQSYTERRIRAAISAVPDGVYVGEDLVDDDGLSETPLLVRSTVTVKGDSIFVDFEGTSPQVPTNMNSPFASTISAVLSCVKTVLTSPDIPFNDGMNRAVTVSAPKGSLLNPHHPAPVRARMSACYRVHNATMRALAKAVPEQVIASGFDCTTVACLSWLSPKGYSVYIEVYGGGWGASAGGDGCNAVDSPLSNCSNTPVEAMDQDFSFFRVLEYAMRPDSFGHGEHRGGMGFYRSYEILRDGTQIALYGDRFRRGAEGLFGGTSGDTGSCKVVRDGKPIDLRSKDSFDLKRGDVVTFTLGGGAGYGDPKARTKTAIARDIAQGALTPETARKFYGYSESPHA
jgi:N-methylhydantoinase B